MIERLTNRTDGGIAYTKIPANESNMVGVGECYTGRIIDRLAAYEDSGLTPEQVQELAQAKADGRLVVLPCKVGDAVYEPFAGKVYEKTVDRIIINRFTTPQIWIETKLPFATPRLERWDMAIGKTVFLSREAAEKALGVGE